MTPSIGSREAASPRPIFRPDLAFPCLTPEMLERLRSYGTEHSYPAGTSLFTRGQRDIDMFVVLDGTVEVLAGGDDSPRSLIAVLEASQFTGELDLLSSRQNLVDARATSPSNLLRIVRSELQQILRTEGDITNLIMQATIWRRIGIIENGSVGITLVGASNAAETIHLQRFLVRNGYPLRTVDPYVQADAEQKAVISRAEPTSLPTVVLCDGRVLRRPTIPLLADQLGITEQLDQNKVYDVAVVGAGPSGLAAAVYAASEGLSTMVIDGVAPGGQAGTSSRIENYLGFPTGVSGQELANRAQVQAQKFGARMAISRDVVGVRSSDGIHHLLLEDGTSIRAKSVIAATGARYRKLEIDNYSRFEFQGIHYAATAMEAALCRSREVAVVGGGNSAGQAAIYLSDIASHVYLLLRGTSLQQSMSDYLIQRVSHSAKITVHTDTDVTRLDGDESLESVTWRNRLDDRNHTHPVTNMFVMIGADPNTQWLRETVRLDSKGFVVTGHEVNPNSPSLYATSYAGIFAVGDVRADSVKRVASAVGEGSVVISDVHRYLRDLFLVVPERNTEQAKLTALTVQPLTL